MEGFGFSSFLVGIGNVRNKRHYFISKVSKLLIFDEREFFQIFPSVVKWGKKNLRSDLNFEQEHPGWRICALTNLEF